jgi:hypothetical protein
MNSTINPIANIVPDNMFHALLGMNLLNRKTIRDIEMKRKYNDLRNSGISSIHAIDYLLQEYPYLQFDTMRKIIYSVRLPEEGNGTHL